MQKRLSHRQRKARPERMTNATALIDIYAWPAASSKRCKLPFAATFKIVVFSSTVGSELKFSRNTCHSNYARLDCLQKKYLAQSALTELEPAQTSNASCRTCYLSFQLNAHICVVYCPLNCRCLPTERWCAAFRRKAISI